MAIIYSYPEVTSLQVTDRFIISRFPASLGDISNYSLDVDTLATFVTARVNLNFLGDSGTGIINLDTQNLTVSGTTNEIETSASGQTLQIGLPDNVTITNNLTIGGDLDVAGAVRLGFTGNDPVILGNPTGKRTEWNNPGYFEIYAENPDVPGDFNETIDIDGEFLGGGYIGVYPVRTEDKHGVRMHSRDDGGLEANFIDIASVESSTVRDEDQIRLITNAGGSGTFAGIKVSHPTDNRFRFNSEFNIEPTVPFLVNDDAKINGSLTMGTNPIFLGGTGAANELNDYEEGSWTPALVNTGGLGISYATQSGTYVKVGKMVFIKALITVNTLSFNSTSGSFGVTLPFTASTPTANDQALGHFNPIVNKFITNGSTSNYEDTYNVNIVFNSFTSTPTAQFLLPSTSYAGIGTIATSSFLPATTGNGASFRFSGVYESTI